MGERSVNHEDMAWEDAIRYPGGSNIKVLMEERSKRTFLLEVPKGSDMGAHCHTAVAEQHIRELQD